MWNLKIFKSCFCKNYRHSLTYEDNLYLEDDRSSLLEDNTVNIEEFDLDSYLNLNLNFEIEKRVRNMCYRWRIKRLDALELIENVDSQQT